MHAENAFSAQRSAFGHGLAERTKMCDCYDASMCMETLSQGLLAEARTVNISCGTLNTGTVPCGASMPRVSQAGRLHFDAILNQHRR